LAKSRFPRALGAAAVGGLLWLAGCSSAPDSVRAASVKNENTRKTAPNFTLKDADGRSVKLSDYKGKVVLLNFWATWCGPCKIEIPWFVDFEQKYKDRGFAVLGVSMDDDGWSAVKPYITDKKLNYRVLLGNDTVGDQYGGVDSLPTTFLLDRTGRVAATHIGLVSKSDYQNEILLLLDEKHDGAGASKQLPRTD
jgi:cytochrome c biogenesis protein CcmG/thiol:disulfide interchange protein DsbE